MKKTIKLCILLNMIIFSSCTEKNASYMDKSHFSQVFGREKSYRIYLPSNYNSSEQRFPAIYFFHGWGGRHFKDPSAHLDYENIGKIVDKYQVILVMWDGNMDELEPRPYNIGSHADVKFNIQMKDYFPELVSHIDSTYRTLTDRKHRGIIGFSMGGFMSYYIAGKFPDKVTAAVNMVGSPDFFVGLPENHTHYPIKYTFANLKDLSLLFINRSNCPMVGLNGEVNKAAHWFGLKDYNYQKLEGEHQVDNVGETKVLESTVKFVVDHFSTPTPVNKRWTHYDLCPQFNIWDYSVESNKSEPGFLVLKNVDKSGFGFYSQKWLPDGPPLKNTTATVTTPPVYAPDSLYTVQITLPGKKVTETRNIRSDRDGRLRIRLSETECEVGILTKNQQADIVVSDYQLEDNHQFLRVGEPQSLRIKLLNRIGGQKIAGNLRVELSCLDTTVSISPTNQTFNADPSNNSCNPPSFKIFCGKQPPSDGAPAMLNMQVKIKSDTLLFEDHFLLPVWYDVPYFDDIQIDDGIAIAPTHVQGDYLKNEIDSVYGTGNGDGVANPSEKIMIYQDSSRLRLYTEDPYVIHNDEKLVDEMLPAVWPDGYTFSSVVKIAEDCPEGHEIEFLGHFETRTHQPIYRTVNWGKIKIKVHKTINKKNGQ